MSLAATYEKIDAAFEQGYRDGLNCSTRHAGFEFPNERRSYEDGVKKADAELAARKNAGWPR